VSSRDAIDVRVNQLIPGDAYGLYDVRWRRMLRDSGARPHYFAVGATGFYRFGRVETGHPSFTRRYREIDHPQLLSVTVGWQAETGNWTVPFEFTGLAHPYGALAGMVTIGVTWSPRIAARR
jgi:hypothetical protein